MTSWLWSLLLIVGVVVTGCSSSKRISETGDARTDAVLQQASDLMGTAYCPSGTTTDCFDCSGFVCYCFLKANIALPRSSREMFDWAGGTPRSRSDLRAGDLVFFNTVGKHVSHVGIFIGKNSFVHASTSAGVIVTSLDDQYWRARYVGARHVL